MPETTRRKISEAQRGRPKTKKHRQALSRGQKRRWAKVREAQATAAAVSVKETGSPGSYAVSVTNDGRVRVELLLDPVDALRLSEELDVAVSQLSGANDPYVARPVVRSA